MGRGSDKGWDWFRMADVCTDRLVFGHSDIDPQSPNLILDNEKKMFLVSCAIDKGFGANSQQSIDELIAISKTTRYKLTQ
ncbi:hypothetical protein [Methyloraptor flagellatus]|uniref:Uncharacterized protein n=1 Tax=Methyloraptor flagellatus TaxID=3162530 RepID=A0AAU7XA96_9HYPH